MVDRIDSNRVECLDNGAPTEGGVITAFNPSTISDCSGSITRDQLRLGGDRNQEFDRKSKLKLRMPLVTTGALSPHVDASRFGGARNIRCYGDFPERSALLSPIGDVIHVNEENYLGLNVIAWPKLEWPGISTIFCIAGA